MWAQPPRRPPLPVAHLDARVEVVAAGLGSDGALLEAALAAGADGLVAVAARRGARPAGVPRRLPHRGARRSRSSPACGRSRAASSAAPTASTARERDVRAAGLILAPALSPAAARITLMACLGAGYSRVAMAAVFAPVRPLTHDSVSARGAPGR